jgi:hypothetical protein
MSGLKKYRATTDASACRLMGDVAGEFVLQSQFLFLQAVEKVFVRVRAVLFFLDQSMQRGVLGFEFLGHCLVHR